MKDLVEFLIEANERLNDRLSVISRANNRKRKALKQALVALGRKDKDAEVIYQQGVVNGKLERRREVSEMVEMINNNKELDRLNESNSNKEQLLLAEAEINLLKANIEKLNEQLYTKDTHFLALARALDSEFIGTVENTHVTDDILENIHNCVNDLVNKAKEIDELKVALTDTTHEVQALRADNHSLTVIEELSRATAKEVSDRAKKMKYIHTAVNVVLALAVAWLVHR